jgi:hypothetical protein
MAKAKKATKKKPAKKSTKRAPKKGATKRRATRKAASHHLDRAHSSVMRALAIVKKGDVDALKRIGRAVEHATENARGAKE